MEELRHAEVLQRVGQGGGDLRHVPGKAGTAADVGVDGVGCGFAVLLGQDGLLFKKRGEKLVGVLNRTQGQNVRGIDLVQDLYLAVQGGVSRQGVLFQVVDAGFERLRVAADRSDGQKGVGVGSIG